MKVSMLATVTLMAGSQGGAHNRWIKHVGKLGEKLSQFRMIACIKLRATGTLGGMFDDSAPAQDFLRQCPPEDSLHVEKRQHAIEPAPHGRAIGRAMSAKQRRMQFGELDRRH